MENSNYKTKSIEKKYANSWYVWLINYIPEPIKKIVGGISFVSPKDVDEERVMHLKSNNIDFSIHFFQDI